MQVCTSQIIISLSLTTLIDVQYTPTSLTRNRATVNLGGVSAMTMRGVAIV